MPFSLNRSAATVSQGWAGKHEFIKGSLHGVAILQNWGQFCVNVSMSLDAPGHQTEDTSLSRHRWIP